MQHINTERKFDVFLSHSSVDKEWVIKLKNSLAKYEVLAWLDKDELRPGGLLNTELKQALENSRCMALIVSPDSIKSGWVQKEHSLALELTADKKDFRLIPVLLRDAEMPESLQKRNWVDFRDESQFNQSVWKLVWGITGEKPKQILDVSAINFGRTKIKPKVTRPESSLFPGFNGILADELIEDTREIIAIHGLDDNEWSKAISAQYFLVGLARELEITGQRDYENLLNTFLKSFHWRADGTIVLDKDHILVTPEELKKIVECMKEEDELDGYYQRSNKTKWQNIDPWQLHYNYLYGLTVEISSDPNFEPLKAIQQLAIRELIYGKNPARLDDYGGWYPYRIPWITARILTALKHSRYENRSDAKYIEKVVNKALHSLVRRIFNGNYWRSGVGTWVSQWESTALCLEALNEWDYIEKNERYRTKIHKVINYTINHEEQWLIDPPNFTDASVSNDTLASAILVSVIIQIVRKQESFRALPIDYIKYQNYLKKCVETIYSTQNPDSRQFCTIPQVAYYVVKALK